MNAFARVCLDGDNKITDFPLMRNTEYEGNGTEISTSLIKEAAKKRIGKNPWENYGASMQPK
jgi:hypothetical protein